MISINTGHKKPKDKKFSRKCIKGEYPGRTQQQLNMKHKRERERERERGVTSKKGATAIEGNAFHTTIFQILLYHFREIALQRIFNNGAQHNVKKKWNKEDEWDGDKEKGVRKEENEPMMEAFMVAGERVKVHKCSRENGKRAAKLKWGKERGNKGEIKEIFCCCRWCLFLWSNTKLQIGPRTKRTSSICFFIQKTKIKKWANEIIFLNIN